MYEREAIPPSRQGLRRGFVVVLIFLVLFVVCLEIVEENQVISRKNNHPPANTGFKSSTERCLDTLKTPAYFYEKIDPFVRANMPGASNVVHVRTTMRGTTAIMAFTVYEPIMGVTLKFEAEAMMNMARCYPDDVQIYQVYE